MEAVLAFPLGQSLLDRRDVSGDTALHCVASSATGDQPALDGASRIPDPETCHPNPETRLPNPET